MELYLTHNGYIYRCEILTPGYIMDKFTDNPNQYFSDHRLKFKICEITTITDEELPYKSKFNLDEIHQYFTKIIFYKSKQNAFYASLTQNKIITNNENQDNNYYKINNNIKLFKNNYSNEHKIYYEDGILAAEFFHINGKIEGIYKEYMPENILSKEIQFLNGKKNGYYKNYYNNNCIEEKYYIDDKLDGICKIGLSHGYEIVTYKDCKRNGLYEEYTTRFFLSGYDLIIKCYYKDDKLEGEYKKYSNGKLIIDCFYVDGLKHGTYTTYVNYGKYYLINKIEYNHGKRHGMHLTFDEHGKITHNLYYENDKLKK